MIGLEDNVSLNVSPKVFPKSATSANSKKGTVLNF